MFDIDLESLLSKVGESISILDMYFSYLYSRFDRRALIDVYLFRDGCMTVGFMC